MKSTRKARCTGSQNMRSTIGYFTHHMNDHNGEALWAGAVDAARNQDVNLICFAGGMLRKGEDSWAQGNILYDLVTPENVDGVVSWNSMVCQHLDHDEMISFYHRYHPLPIVSMTQRLEGRPVVVVETYQGMREAIAHLIEVHRYRRIAFIRGPESHFYAQERYRAYTDVLEEYGILFDPNLVTPPAEWLDSTGPKAIQLLLDERKLLPHVDVEAVVADTDLFALGALQALHERGIRVPEDVAVVGFNDFMEDRWLTPPLTSVAMPFRKQGEQAVKILLMLLKDKEVPEQVSLSARLVIRQSCGCMSATVMQAATMPQASSQGSNFETAFAAQRATLLSEMLQAVGTPVSGFDPGWAEYLLDAFAAEIGGKSSASFLSELHEMLRQVIAANKNVLAWQNVISVLRRHTLPYLSNEELLSRVETLWGQTRVMIGETAERARGYQQLQAQRQAEILRDITQVLSTTFDVKGLMDVLAEGLPRLGIPGCYLALYENSQSYRYPQPAPEWSRLVLAYNEHGRIDLEGGGRRFLSRLLAPADMLPWNRSYSLVVEPLYFGEEQLGFVVFEVGPKDGALYETLQVEISSALQGALLVQRVQKHAAEVARQKYILDTFMETVPDRIYFKDLNSRYTRANKAHAIKLGIGDPAQEVGKTDFDFYPEEVARRTRKDELKIIHTGEAMINKEVHETRPDGSVRWSLTTKMSLRDEHGAIIGTFGISRDITPLKQTQEALEQAYAEVEKRVEERTAELQQEIAVRERTEEEMRHLRNLLSNIVNSMPSILVGVDLEEKVTQWNREAEKATGVTADKAQGRLLNEVFPELAGEMEKVGQAIQDRQPQKTEKLARKTDGETHYWDLMVYPLIVANCVEGAVIRIDDVTDRVRVEEMMIHTEKMMTVGGLAAGMAHEINNPLGIILQGIQNIQRRLSPELEKNRQMAEKIGIDLGRIRMYLEQRNFLQYLTGMQEAGIRASRIVTNMLNFSRHSESRMAPTDINRLLDETLKLADNDYDLKKKYDFRNIDIIRDYDVRLTHVPCIAPEVEQVVLNLLKNAVQALAEKHKEGYTPQIKLSTRKEQSYAAIMIEDNGLGMDQKTKKRIFEPFYTTKSVGIGTGLGLSVSYFIILTHHKGTIAVESEPGKGTTFTIRLPLLREG